MIYLIILGIRIPQLPSYVRRAKLAANVILVSVGAFSACLTALTYLSPLRSPRGAFARARILLVDRNSAMRSVEKRVSTKAIARL